jgi:hypothetical protein
MVTDNFDKYKQFLIGNGFPEKKVRREDTFPFYYVIEIIRRGKDNPDTPAANVHFKNYYIKYANQIDELRNEIKLLCDTFKMRAYASVNIKDAEAVTVTTAQELIRRLGCKDFRKPWNVFESCSSKFLIREDKKWTVDIDNVESEDDDKVVAYKNTITKCSPNYENTVITTFKTNSGLHLITKPFSRYEYDNLREDWMEPAKDLIKTNHLTLLYCYDKTKTE